MYSGKQDRNRSLRRDRRITGPSRFRSFLTRIPDSQRAFRGISVSRAALLISRSTEETSRLCASTDSTRRKPASWKRVPLAREPLGRNPARRRSTRACVQLNPTISQEIIFPRMTVARVVCAIESCKRFKVCRLSLRFMAFEVRGRDGPIATEPRGNRVPGLFPSPSPPSRWGNIVSPKAWYNSAKRSRSPLDGANLLWETKAREKLLIACLWKPSEPRL